MGSSTIIISTSGTSITSTSAHSRQPPLTAILAPGIRYSLPTLAPCMLFLQVGSNVRDAGAEEHRLPFLPPLAGQTGRGFPRPALASIRDRTAVTVDDLQGNARGSSPPQRLLV